MNEHMKSGKDYKSSGSQGGQSQQKKDQRKTPGSAPGKQSGNN